MNIYIYIYISAADAAPDRQRGSSRSWPRPHAVPPNLPNIMDFRGFDSSIILIIRGGIPRPMGNSPESLSQAILVGVILVGRLGVVEATRTLKAGWPPRPQMSSILQFAWGSAFYIGTIQGHQTKEYPRGNLVRSLTESL